MSENMLRSFGNPGQGRVEQTPDREGRDSAHSHRYGGPRDSPRSSGKAVLSEESSFPMYWLMKVDSLLRSTYVMFSQQTPVHGAMTHHIYTI